MALEVAVTFCLKLLFSSFFSIFLCKMVNSSEKKQEEGQIAAE